MMKMRYVGGAPAEIHNTPFNFTGYGQLVEMPDELAKQMMRELPLITADDFNSIKHPDTELAQFRAFESHSMGTPGFLERRKQAWMMVFNNHNPQLLPAPVAQDKDKGVIDA